MKKFCLSLVRTMISMWLIKESVWMFQMARHWWTWAPNNDDGLWKVVLAYISSANLFFGGIFGLAPVIWLILWGGLVIKLGAATPRQVRKDLRKWERWFIW